ncbi:MAG: o-succinylbenzoate synthase [Flavobacteriales bacterium]
MLEAAYRSYKLLFKRPAGTARGVLHQRPTWFITLRQGEKTGIGECGLFPGLSVDDRPDFEKKLRWTCENIHLGPTALAGALLDFPTIRFGLEMAFKSLEAEHNMELFPSSFTRGRASIPINGLVWMGDADFMRAQIRAHIERGFSCIKMKVGALDFDVECEILGAVRQTFSAQSLTLRLDANGAFSAREALRKLKILSRFEVHSIEQPIAPGKWKQLAELCARTPIPIALDESLIGVHTKVAQAALLDAIAPQYIVLKPTLVGGFAAAAQWIRRAEQRRIGWWITSALESHIGLNAIAQWVYTRRNPTPQGLGTGSLFTNDIASPLRMEGGCLRMAAGGQWNLDILEA